MDPSYINTKNRRGSIVKEAPRSIRELDDRPARQKNRTELGTSSKLSHKCHKNVTKETTPTGKTMQVSILNEAPLQGGAATRRGGNHD